MSDTAGQSVSGAEFRRKFEELQAERDAAVGVARSLASAQFKYVQPGDFEGVALQEYVKHAETVSNTRANEREALFLEEAKARGIDLNALSTGAPAAATKDDFASRLASLGEQSGRPPAAPDPTQGLDGRQLLEAIYAAEGTS